MLICVISPFRASAEHSQEENVALVKRLCRAIALAGDGMIPYAAHLLCPQFLDDAVEDERRCGLRIGQGMLSYATEVWIWDLWGISEGMKWDIALAAGFVRMHTPYTAALRYASRDEIPPWSKIIAEFK